MHCSALNGDFAACPPHRGMGELPLLNFRQRYFRLFSGSSECATYGRLTAWSSVLATDFTTAPRNHARQSSRLRACLESFHPSFG